MSKQKLYANGKKIRVGQVWQDIGDVKYDVLELFPDTNRVSLKRLTDNHVIEESCVDMVLACNLFKDAVVAKR